MENIVGLQSRNQEATFHQLPFCLRLASLSLDDQILPDLPIPSKNRYVAHSLLTELLVARYSVLGDVYKMLMLKI